MCQYSGNFLLSLRWGGGEAALLIGTEANAAVGEGGGGEREGEGWGFFFKKIEQHKGARARKNI